MTRLFIRLVSLLVPAALRERWREEWQAELSAQPRRFDPRVFGALNDAVATRRACRTPRTTDFENPGTPRTPGPRDSGLAGITEDARLSLRLARRNPGHSALTIVVIALGVGLMTAVLSIGYAIFLKPWPIHEPERVAFVFRNTPIGMGGGRLNEHTPDFNVVAQNDAIGAIAGFQQLFPLITIGDITERRAGELVTTEYFKVIGVTPMIGRDFNVEDDAPANTELTMVISHRLWQRSFAGRRDIVGQRVPVEDKVATIIGVLGPGFYGLSSAYEHRDWWMPARAFRKVLPGSTVIRLTPGASAAQAEAGLAGYGLHVEQLERAKGFGAPPEGTPVFKVVPANQMRTPTRPSEEMVPRRIMWGLIAVVAMVLMIAVTSIAGLGVARGLDRESEVATRRVLGVSTWRLGRQLVIEQSLLMIAGGLLASAVAWNLIVLAIRSVPESYVIAVGPDWWLFGMAMTVALGIGVLISLGPLRHALRIDLLHALHGTSATTAKPASRLGLISLTPQITLAILLLVTAGVHVRALVASETTDLGYTIDGRVILEVDSSGGILSDTPLPGAQRRAMLTRLSAAAANWPGVTAGFIESLPLRPTGNGGLASSETSVRNNMAEAVAFGRRHTSPGTFTALNMPILAGRDFSQRDYEHQAPVAIVTETFARRLWPDANPIGQRFTTHSINGATDLIPGSGGTPGKWVEVIGTVPDVIRLVRSNRETHPVYTVADAPFLRLYVILAGTADPTLVSRIRDDIQALHPTLRVTSIRPMAALADDILRPRRTAATILTVTGLAGLALACIGLYAHVALSVARRRREFGIRSALGASTGTLVWHVVRDHGRIALLGAVLGLGGAITTLRLSSRVVRDVPTSDLTTFVVVPLILVAVCLLACMLPARRTGAIDPVTTLKA